MQPTADLSARAPETIAADCTLWRYAPYKDNKIGIRSEPEFAGQRTKQYLQPGEEFSCSRELQDEKQEVLYLKLADGRGWVFDRLPKDKGAGVMCVRHEACPQTGRATAAQQEDVLYHPDLGFVPPPPDLEEAIPAALLQAADANAAEKRPAADTPAASRDAEQPQRKRQK